MNAKQIAAHKALEQAQQALKQGDKHTARHFAEQAAHTAPELEEVWLIMAALASPRASVAFLEKALQINPHSARAQKGMAWASERLHKEVPRQQMSVEKARLSAAKSAPARKKKAPSTIRISYVLSALIALCLGVSAIIVLSAANPAAFIGSNIVTREQEDKSWTQVNYARAIDTATSAPTQMPSPTFTLTATLSPTATFTPTVTYTATATPTETPTLIPTDLPTEAASPTPLPTDTAEPIPTQYVQAQTSSGSGGVHWIEVDLSDQMVYAYEGKTIVNSFLVSTGVSQYKTITGSFHIYDKVLSGNMWGPGYYLPDVPYIMYFQKGYALHGTYWHNNFGTPMSHGCVNLSIPDAEWLYYWAPLGTSVKVHQ